MLNALKKSLRKLSVCSFHRVKDLDTDISICSYPGPRRDMGRTLPKVSVGCAPKMQVPALGPRFGAAPQAVPWTAVPKYALSERLTIFSGRYWFGLAVAACTRLE